MAIQFDPLGNLSREWLDHCAIVEAVSPPGDGTTGRRRHHQRAASAELYGSLGPMLENAYDHLSCTVVCWTSYL